MKSIVFAHIAHSILEYPALAFFFRHDRVVQFFFTCPSRSCFLFRQGGFVFLVFILRRKEPKKL